MHRGHTRRGLHQCFLWAYLRQLQRSHDGRKTKHVAHGALELGRDLDHFVQQAGPLLGRPSASQHIHSQRGRHGLEPAGEIHGHGCVCCLLEVCPEPQRPVLAHLSSRSSLSLWPCGNVRSSIPELTPIIFCTSEVTSRILATWKTNRKFLIESGLI